MISGGVLDTSLIGYNLVLDADSPLSFFRMEVGPSCIALFTEHSLTGWSPDGPLFFAFFFEITFFLKSSLSLTHWKTEFEIEGLHFLKDQQGNDIEVEEHHHGESQTSAWGIAMGATIITIVPTLLGVTVAFGFVKRYPWVLDYLNSFAGGALLSAVFVHVYPGQIVFLQIISFSF